MTKALFKQGARAKQWSRSGRIRLPYECIALVLCDTSFNGPLDVEFDGVIHFSRSRNSFSYLGHGQVKTRKKVKLGSSVKKDIVYLIQFRQRIRKNMFLRYG